MSGLNKEAVDFESYSKIQDIITSLTKDLDKQELVHGIINNALQNLGSLNSEDKHGILMKIET